MGTHTSAVTSEASAGSFDRTEIWFSDSDGDGPVVVLLHGLAMTSRSNFEVFYGPDGDGGIGPAAGPTIAGLLRAAGGRVIGIDARGHGRSGHSTDPQRYRGQTHALDVVAVLDAIDAREVHVIGYSMGSLTAMRLGSIDPRVRSLTLCGTGPHLVDGVSPMMRTIFDTLGRCFASNSWNEHPYLKPFRAFAAPRRGVRLPLAWRSRIGTRTDSGRLAGAARRAGAHPERRSRRRR